MRKTEPQLKPYKGKRGTRSLGDGHFKLAFQLSGRDPEDRSCKQTKFSVW